MDRPLTIAVTGLNAIDSPGPGVAVIRALREGLPGPLRIIGLSYEALEPGIYLHDLVDRTYQLPYPSAGTEALRARLAYIYAREQLDMVLPNFDAELPNFIRISPVLKSMGISSFLPTTEQFESRDKINLNSFCRSNGFDVPEDRVIHRAEELAACGEAFGYPLVVKGRYYEAIVAHTAEQAHKAFYALSGKWGLPIIVQQFIRGTEINIAVLGDGQGEALSVVPMRKLYITDKGKAWAGVTLEDEDLVEAGWKFARASKWRGGCELEIMRTDEGKLYIMEINPRFPAWIYLTAAAGQNQPAALVRLAMGLPMEPFKPYQSGKVFIRYSWDHIIDIAEFQRVSGFGEG
jgi:carbamoyl-phosphate synthase large subunit